MCYKQCGNIVCPSVGDMPPYLSRWRLKRILGGWCPQATEELSPVADGSLPPLGTVRCYFYVYVINDCPMSAKAFPGTAVFLFVNLKVILDHTDSLIISISVADVSVMTA